jgi:hypothetical protein
MGTVALSGSMVSGGQTPQTAFTLKEPPQWDSAIRALTPLGPCRPPSIVE